LTHLWFYSAFLSRSTKSEKTIANSRHVSVNLKKALAEMFKIGAPMMNFATNENNRLMMAMMSKMMDRIFTISPPLQKNP